MRIEPVTSISASDPVVTSKPRGPTCRISFFLFSPALKYHPTQQNNVKRVSLSVSLKLFFLILSSKMDIKQNLNSWHYYGRKEKAGKILT